MAEPHTVLLTHHLPSVLPPQSPRGRFYCVTTDYMGCDEMPLLRLCEQEVHTYGLRQCGVFLQELHNTVRQLRGRGKLKRR